MLVHLDTVKAFAVRRVDVVCLSDARRAHAAQVICRHTELKVWRRRNHYHEEVRLLDGKSQ
jgi:hypothetical protein